MADAFNLLSSLQQADSFFPSGAMAFSWGLESLMRDGLVSNKHALAEFVEAQLAQRWISLDQGLLSAAWQAADMAALLPEHASSGQQHDMLEAREEAVLDAVFDIDQLAEAMSLSASLREGSRRLGATLIDVHVRLATPAALRLKRRIGGKRNSGHLAVVQGYLFHELGMDELSARAVSAHGVSSGMVSAAVRLGLIGHLDAQRILTAQRPLLQQALQRPAPSLADLSSAVFAIDIAGLRHGSHDGRLFAN